MQTLFLREEMEVDGAFSHGLDPTGTFAASGVHHQLHALTYDFENFLRTLATPKPIKVWTLTTLKEKLIKIGANAVTHGRYVAFQMAGVAVPRGLFPDILRMIAELRPPSTA